MRLTNLLVTGTLFVAVIAEGAYIVKTHRQMVKLTAQVEQLAVEAVDEPIRDQVRMANGAGVGQRPTATPPSPGKVPPPRFNTPPPPVFTSPSAAGGPALPPVLDNPEARAQLKQFVAAEMQSQREEWRQQQIQGRDEENRRRLEDAVSKLGLSESDGRKLTEIVNQSQDQRNALREKIQSGQIPREQVPQAMMSLRDQTDKQIRALVGEEKAQKFQELTRPTRGPGGGGRGGFGGPGFAGGQPRPPQP